jgi:hypothetical protein
VASMAAIECEKCSCLSECLLPQSERLTKVRMWPSSSSRAGSVTNGGSQRDSSRRKALGIYPVHPESGGIYWASTAPRATCRGSFWRLSSPSRSSITPPGLAVTARRGEQPPVQSLILPAAGGRGSSSRAWACACPGRPTVLGCRRARIVPIRDVRCRGRRARTWLVEIQGFRATYRRICVVRWKVQQEGGGARRNRDRYDWVDNSPYLIPATQASPQVGEDHAPAIQPPAATGT